MISKDLSLIKLTIIIPIFNEANSIELLLTEIEKQHYVKKQIILINDCSTDESLEKINNFNFNSEFKIINHKKNLGKGGCIISAKKYINGDLVLIQDADLEYDPSDYKILLKSYINSNYEVIYGSRILNKNFSNFTSHGRLLANKFLTLFSNIFNGQKLTDAHTCYKMLKYEVFQKIDIKEKGFALCPEINTKLSNLKISILEVPIKYKGRTYDEGKKIKFFHGLEALYAIIKYKLF